MKQKIVSFHYHVEYSAEVEGKEGKHCLHIKIIYAPF